MRRALLLIGLVACGPSVKTAAQRDAIDFQCKERVASYVASGHMAADEVGVQLDCADGPRVKRWKSDNAGRRDEQVIAISPAEFDKVWKEIDGVGWPNLKNCTNGDSDKAPLYIFDIKDDQNKVSFECQSSSMPFPYNNIVDPLDMVGLAHQGQLGDDEPDELKQFDKRDMQK